MDRTQNTQANYSSEETSISPPPFLETSYEDGVMNMIQLLRWAIDNKKMLELVYSIPELRLRSRIIPPEISSRWIQPVEIGDGLFKAINYATFRDGTLENYTETEGDNLLRHFKYERVVKLIVSQIQ